MKITDYEFPSFKDIKEKTKAILLADTFRLYKPYGFWVDEESKKAYAFNRKYNFLGQDNERINVLQELPAKDGTVMLYDDGTQPWLKKKDYDEYIKKLREVLEKYEVVSIWGTFERN